MSDESARKPRLMEGSRARALPFLTKEPKNISSFSHCGLLVQLNFFGDKVQPLP